MGLIAKEYIGSVCEIKTMDNFLVGAGLIQEIGEETVAIVNTSDGLPAMRQGASVKLHIFNQQHGFLALGGKVESSKYTIVKLGYMRMLTGSEKREYFRLYTDIEALLFRFKDGVDDMMDADVFEVKIKDISLGGLQFICEEVLEEKQLLLIEFMLPRGSLSLNLIVCRAVPAEDGNHSYGCEFLDVPDRTNEILCQYLFQKQRAQLQKI